MSEPLRVAVIGTGSIADAHLYAYSKIPEQATVGIVVDVAPERAQRAAERWSVPETTVDYHEVLARDDIAAVSICTPPFLHADISADFLRAGKHVLCEKPVAATLAELDKIDVAQRESGSIFAGIFQWRFGRGARQVRLLADEGRFGRLASGMAETLWFRDHPYYDDVAWRGTWREECGGVTVSQAIHAIDCLIWILGEPVSVFAESGTFRAKVETDDTTVAVIRFAGGAIGQVTSTVNAMGPERTRIEFHGTDLTAIGGGEAYDTTKDLFTLATTDPAKTEALSSDLEERVPKGPSMLHRPVVSDFIDAIQSGRPPLVDVAECRKALQVTAAIYKSAMTNEVVKLPMAPDDPWYSALPPEGYHLA
jgi:predicted dehydrogenase